MPETQLDRIERKLDRILSQQATLLQALAEDEEPPPSRTLEGQEQGSERDQTQSLG